MTGLGAAAAALDVDRVQVLFADQHGLLKGRSVRRADLDRIDDEGIGVPGSILAKDTGNVYAVPVWARSGDPVLDDLMGARNMVLRPDASTLVPMPWAPGRAMVLCDLHTTTGDAIAYSTRALARRQIDALASRGWSIRAGLEYEFHLFRNQPGEPVSHGHRGWDLLGAAPLDEIDDVLGPIIDGLVEMGLTPVTAEAELGPSQVEMTFEPDDGLAIADNAVIVKHAIRALARSVGCHATFMSRPAVGDSFPSGWHMHQSLVSVDERRPLFGVDGEREQTELGSSWLAGLLEHAAAACMLTTPTITGYKRFRPHAVTPDRVSWSHEHRGAMMREVGEGLGIRFENRAGDPAANPYLYLASQIASGLLGVDDGLTAGPPSDDPYVEAAGALLPRSLGEAIDAFAADDAFRGALGHGMADYLQLLKQSEWRRFLTTVTDWEQREYFSLF